MIILYISDLSLQSSNSRHTFVAQLPSYRWKNYAASDLT